MGNEAGLLFNVPVSTSFCTLEDHEHLIIALFISIISCINLRGTWTMKVSDWSSGAAGDLHT